MKSNHRVRAPRGRGALRWWGVRCRCYNGDTGEEFTVDIEHWDECSSIEAELRDGLYPDWECRLV
jgi:hypothetical protein